MSLVICGVKIPLTDKVKENIQFRPGDPNTSLQTMDWRGVGMHWTGGEGNSDRVIRVLKARDLSVHFVLDKDGTLVQCADIHTRCAHIGSPGNGRFIGVETVCRGFATKEDLALAKIQDPTLRDREDLDWQEQRDTYRDTIGSREVCMASFGPNQVESLVWLCDFFAHYYNFPRVIPARKVTQRDIDLADAPVDVSKYVVKHNGALWLPLFDRNFSKSVKGRAATFEGVLGHFHINKQKYDPGTEVFYALWAEGYNPTGCKITGLR